MEKNISENTKLIPASLLVFGKKRIAEIRAFARTKFGNSLIHVKVNREKERFDILVQDSVRQADVTDFEKMWTMCKILRVK